MSLDKLNFTKDWRKAADFPTYEGSEEQVRADMQLLHEETRQYLNDYLIPEILAADATEAAREAAEAERDLAEGERERAELARQQAESARADAESIRRQKESERISAEQARADETSGIVAQATEQAEAAERSAQSASSSVTTASNLAGLANTSRVAAENAAASAKASETAAANAETNAASSMRSAEYYASAAKESEQTISVFQNDCYTSKIAAKASATESQSWAVGGTGTREGEDTDNAKYWAGVAQSAAGSTAGVTSFNGRSGAVKPQAGDYTADQVGALSAGGGSLSGYLIMQGNQIQYLGNPRSDTDAVNKMYVDGLVGEINTVLDAINGEVV